VRREADVVVVGGGITGAATLRALARAGADALGLERFEVGNARGSSHGASRIFRLSYPEPAYTRLALAALAGWRELENECGERLVVHTGSLDAGDAAVDTERSLIELGLAFEVLSGAETSQRWPFAFEPSSQLVFQADGGFLLADRALAALVTSARAAGGELVEQEQVVRIDAHPRGASIVTETRKIEARAVVVAAGAWARDLLSPLGIELPVVAARETVSYYSMPGVEELPPIIEYPSQASPLPDEQAYYALPAPGRGLKAGIHHSGRTTDPEADGVLDEAVIAATSAWVARRFPTADPAPLAAETCIYTNTSDASFVIEAHGRVVVASACSGHGFKFAPAHGSLVANLALAAGQEARTEF
jgi:sarcosine oxidase